MPLIALAQSLYAHSALTDASVAVNNAYHYFADTRSPKEALHFLSEVKLYI